MTPVIIYRAGNPSALIASSDNPRPHRDCRTTILPDHY